MKTLISSTIIFLGQSPGATLDFIEISGTCKHHSYVPNWQGKCVEQEMMKLTPHRNEKPGTLGP